MLFDKLAEIYFEIIVKSFIEINVHMAKIVFVGKKTCEFILPPICKIRLSSWLQRDGQ